MTTIAALGLMSGTSLDGIDLALVETDGEAVLRQGPSLTVALAPETRAAVRAASAEVRGWSVGTAVPAAVAAAERAVTQAHLAAVAAFFERFPDAADAGLIGFHGQTVLHRPEERLTWQIGDAQALADRFGRPVVAHFRDADVAAGGQGAPLAPLYHRALLASGEVPAAVLNIGGVANVTWIGENLDDTLAFDTGPGNALMDDWALRHTGQPVDLDGALAARGRVDEAVLARLLDHPYFAAPPPKSLDRDDFDGRAAAGLSAADGAATLLAFTVESIAAACRHFPAPVARLLVTGGGRRNPVLMARLSARLGLPVLPVEAAGGRGDVLEAEAFGYLAVRALKGLALSLPGTTGAPRPLTGGQVFRPSRRSR